jgi:hypothetical protein
MIDKQKVSRNILEVAGTFFLLATCFQDGVIKEQKKKIVYPQFIWSSRAN